MGKSAIMMCIRKKRKQKERLENEHKSFWGLIDGGRGKVAHNETAEKVKLY